MRLLKVLEIRRLESVDVCYDDVDDDDDILFSIINFSS